MGSGIVARSLSDRRFRLPQRRRSTRRSGVGCGSGQSGCQIAEDLAEAGRVVFLSTSRTGRLPRRYRGRDIMIWLIQSGFLDVRREQIIQTLGRVPARGVLGSTHTISLQSLSTHGVVLLGRFASVENGRHLIFNDDVDEHIRFADEASINVKRQIDEYILRAGIDAPAAEPDPREIVAPSLPDPPICPLDFSVSGITTVIWCAGFQGDYSWMLSEALDAEGQPLQRDGVGVLPGIYFAGVDFGATRKSGIILAIVEEATRLAEHIVGRSPEPGCKVHPDRLPP